MANTRIADRETAYHARRHDREVREDGTSYKEAMEAANQERERRELIEELRQGDDGKAAGGGSGESRRARASGGAASGRCSEGRRPSGYLGGFSNTSHGDLH